MRTTINHILPKKKLFEIIFFFRKKEYIWAFTTTEKSQLYSSAPSLNMQEKLMVWRKHLCVCYFWLFQCVCVCHFQFYDFRRRPIKCQSFVICAEMNSIATEVSSRVTNVWVVYMRNLFFHWDEKKNSIAFVNIIWLRRLYAFGFNHLSIGNRQPAKICVP